MKVGKNTGGERDFVTARDGGLGGIRRPPPRKPHEYKGFRFTVTRVTVMPVGSAYFERSIHPAPYFTDAESSKYRNDDDG